VDGKGRGENRWLSGAGEGVWASLLFRQLTPGVLAQLPLLCAIALAETLGRLTQVEVGLKWPNDLYVRGAKLGGILIESVSRGASCTGIVGFGVNHALRSPQIEGRQTTSVSDLSGSPPSLGYLTTTLISEVVSTILDPPETQSIVSRYRRLSVHKTGDAMRLSLHNQSIDGEYQGIDDRGMLVVGTENGSQHISAAEVLMP
jgi:BirA family biotin operon repressor/biotin-[acetyl-CoA-carboxylase] ligase